MKRVTLCLAALLVLATVHVTSAQVRRKPRDEPAQKPKTETETETVRKPRLAPAEWAPADALFYLGVTDVEKTWEKFQKTSTYKLMSDPSAAEALSSFNVFGSVFEELRNRLAKALDVQPAQLQNPFGGPLALYLVAPPDAKPDDIEPGLVAGVGDAALMKRYYDTAVSKLKEIGKHETVSDGPHTIDVFTADPDKQKKDEDAVEEDEFGEFDSGQPSPFGSVGGSPDQMLKDGLDKFFSAESLPANLALCLTEEWLIVSGSADHVKAVLQREQSGRTLADTSDHRALLRHLKPTGTVRLLVNLPRIIEMAKAATDESDLEDLRKGLKLVGAESLRSVVGHWRLGASSYDSKFELLFLMGDQRSGLAKLLSMENRPTAPPQTVPAEACIYASCNLNVPQLFDQIEQMIRQNDPEAADQMQAAMEQELPTGETVNLRTAFLDHLRGPLTTTLAFAKPLGPNCLRLTMAIGHRDQDAVVRFLSGYEGMLAPRDLRGTQVFDLMFPPGLCLAPTADQLLAGNTAAVEVALKPAATEPLGGTEGWRRAARFVPKETWFTLYIDQRRFLEAVLELAKSQGEMMAGGTDLGATIIMGMLQSMGQGAQAGDISGADRLLEYAGQTIYTVSTTREGVQLTAVQLKPEK